MTKEMKNKIAGEVYTKLHDGNPIDDNELNVALEEFEHAVAFLECMGDHFFLAASRLRSDIESLKAYKNSRRLRIPIT